MRKLCLMALVIFGAARALAAEATSAFTVVDRGTEAATILRLVGKPDEIKRVKSTSGRVERWIYRHEADRTLMPEKSSPSSFGPLMPNTMVPGYRAVRVVKYEVTALEMVDGKFASAKQWTERDWENVE